MSLFIECKSSVGSSENYQYDLVDFLRQGLCGYTEDLYKKINNETDYDKKIALLEGLIVLIEDHDILLSTRKEFLMGIWV